MEFVIAFLAVAFFLGGFNDDSFDVRTSKHYKMCKQNKYYRGAK